MAYGWATGICLAGGWVPTPSNLKGLNAWIACESAPVIGNNPMNTTDRWRSSGIRPIGPGISEFPDPVTGAMATVRTIRGMDGMRGWPLIEASLRRGTLARDFAANAGGLLDGWGTSPTCVQGALGGASSVAGAGSRGCPTFAEVDRQVVVMYGGNKAAWQAADRWLAGVPQSCWKRYPQELTQWKLLRQAAPISWRTQITGAGGGPGSLPNPLAWAEFLVQNFAPVGTMVAGGALAIVALWLLAKEAGVVATGPLQGAVAVAGGPVAAARTRAATEARGQQRRDQEARSVYLAEQRSAARERGVQRAREEAAREEARRYTPREAQERMEEAPFNRARYERAVAAQRRRKARVS